MVKFEPNSKSSAEGGERGVNILEVIDMDLDSKGGFQTAFGEFWSFDPDIIP